MPYLILVVLLVIGDQALKFWITQNIALGARMDFIPHVMELTYVRNTGAAFSSFSELTWLLTLISVLMSVILAIAVVKKFFSHPIGRTALALVLAGALGNLIDRVLLGYVVDMFHVTFMNFAVFNIADICVVVGGICAAGYYLLCYDKLEKGRDEKGPGHEKADSNPS